MRLEFYGVRGTFPSAGGAETAFGGHTLCAALTGAGGDILIIDAGTGVKPLGDALLKRGEGLPVRASMLFTHFHLDHIIGLPFFNPLFDERTQIDFYSWREPEETRELLGRLTAPPLFPVAFEKTPARKTFHRIGPEGVVLGGIKITTCPLNHPQGCMAYKFEEAGASLVTATDTEHPPEGLDARLAAFVKNASLLIYDAMFTPEDYQAGRVGWGHSTWIEGTRLAKEAGVGRLLLSHLNPDYSDALLRRMARKARHAFRKTDCASEGMRADILGRR